MTQAEYQEAQYKIGTKYRDLFLSSYEGKEVLTCLLRDMSFFMVPQNENQKVMRDFAQGLLEQMGIMSNENMIPLVEKMAQLPDYRVQPIKE